MDPLPLPLMDNGPFVKSLGLRDSIRHEDIPWLKSLIRLFFGHVTPASLHIRKAASTSFPYFEKDIGYKKQGTMKALLEADHFLDLMTGGRAQLEEARDDYHVLLLNAIHLREQPTPVTCEDGIWLPKARKAPLEKEARGHVAEGTQEADFTVRDERGDVIEGHFAMRRRPVWGFSGIVNYFMTAVMGCVREVYTKRFAFTFKTRGWQDKEERIAKYTYVVGSDVKAMDTTVPKWFFEFLLDELPQYWDDRLVELLRRMLYAPFVAAPPWRKTPDDYNPFFGDDPLDGTSDVHAGLPSGVFINPDIGKLWMTFVYVILFRDSGALQDVSEIESFLQGRHPDHALLDMSDDATLLTNSSRVRDKLMVAHSPYAVLEPETPVIFLGDVFTMDAGRKRAYPNPVTYIVNSLARESSIQSMNPIAYAEGVLARFQQYSRTPIFRDLNRIYEEEIRKEYGVNPYLIAASVSKRQKFSEIDALVLANPHYLMFKIDPADVSPEILDDIIASIPATDFFNKIRHLFKVPTVELEEFTKLEEML
jgi:hypothetical protein